MTPHSTRLAVVCLLGALLLPGSAEAQRRGRAPQQADAQGPAPVLVGIHLGYDDISNAEVLGAQLHVPVALRGNLALSPSGNVTFATGLKEYQGNLDLAYTVGRRGSGLYLAGGLAVRNTVFDGPDRETKVGFGVAGGIKTGGPDSLLGLQIELRQIYVDPDLRPRVLTFGLNFFL